MDPRTKRQTLRLLSNGLYVMTSRSGDHYGAATVSWVSQSSFRPPLIMAAVRQDSNVFQCLCASRVAAIHLLGDDQQDLAKKFFSPTKAEAGVINGEPCRPGQIGAPILESAPAYVECRVREIVDCGGDHAVAIMEVVEAECWRQVRPLTIAESPWEYGG